jgi:putative ABC transport system ATP-binding protein
MYRLTDVSKSYRKGSETIMALRNINLVIEDGEWLSIQGRTGHGKSTLLNLLGALDRPTSGTIEFDDGNLATLSEKEITRTRAIAIGFIFQTFNLIPTLSAAENVEAALVPLGISSAERRRRVSEALESVSLSDRAGHLPSELSGGQQQRVGIARALVKRPRALLADEPTGNLDEETRDDVIALLDDIRQRTRITLIMVTHDTALAYRAPSVGVMRDGRLIIRKKAENPAP